MLPKKQNESLILGLAALITGGILVGGWWLYQVGLLPGSPASGGFTSTQANNRNVKVTLKALGDTFSGYSTLRSETFQASLIERGVGLAYADEFDQRARAQAMTEGRIDLLVTSLDQYLTHQPAGKIVALIDRTVGADAVVLNTQAYPQLQSLLDLEQLVAEQRAQGQKLKIVYAGDTPSEFLALILNTRFDNFNLADFEVETVDDASTAWQRMQQDRRVAIAVLWEPYVTTAQQQGNTVVLSSADAPGSIVDVAVASDRLLQSNPQAVKDFVEAYYRRIDTSLQDRDLIPRQIAADGNLDPATAQTIASGIEFFTSVEAQNWMESGTLSQRIGAIAGLLVLAGRLPAPPAAPQNLYTADYLTAVAQQTAGLIDLIAQDNPELAARLQTSRAEEVVQASAQQMQQAPNIGNLTVQGEVQFQTGSAQLTAVGQQTLDRLAAEISEFSAASVGIKVQGHTSRTGPADLNQQLSQQRADVVVSYLRGKQLPHNFFAEGLGFSQPLPGSDPAAAVNQRTVIRLVRLGS